MFATDGHDTGTAVARRFAPFVAAEHTAVYDTSGPAGADDAGAREGRDAGSGGRDARVAPRTAEATMRLERCATTPGSPLGAAMRRLADAVDTLAAVDTHDEHVDVAGDALVAVHHLRARLDATLLDLLATFDRREGWAADGAANASMWLRARTNTDHGAAAALAHAARRLRRLPRLADHLAAGDVTLAHVTAVTKACVPQRAAAITGAQDILCDLAVTNPPRDLRHALRRLADAADPDGSHPHTDDAPGGDPLRELTLRRGYGERGDLVATLDNVTREALTVLLDAFDTPDGPDTPTDRRRSFAQRRHDAFAAMLHTLLARPGLPTVQGARPHILITIDLAALLGLPHDQPQPRPARLGSGATITTTAVRGLLHTATIMAVLTLGPWRAVNVGATHRTLPAWLRGLLAAIHRRCRGPDCDRPTNWTQAHHVTDWATARTTDLNDTLPLCCYHHDLITTKGWKATLDHTTGTVTWTRPDGRTIDVPPHQP